MKKFKNIKPFLDETGRIKTLPGKRKKKLEVLHYLSTKFESGKQYTEKQVNELLNRFHLFRDPALLRRELFEHRYLDRKQDCSFYWRSAPVWLPEQGETKHLIIRDATENERSLLEELYEHSQEFHALLGQEFNPNYVEECLHSGHLPPDGVLENYSIKCFFLKGNHLLVGFIELYHGYPEEDSLYVAFLFLHPRCRNNGLGREIVDYFEATAREANYERITLGVHLKNWNALHFWINNGYRQVRKIVGDKTMDTHSHAILELEKELTP